MLTMRKRPQKAFLAAAALFLEGLVLPVGGPYRRAQATTYSFTTIDVPGATSTFAYGINDAGQIVGTSGGHGFLDTAGRFTPIDVPGAFSTSAYGINDSGQIVGYYTSGFHGFLDTAGSFTTIDVPWASATFAYGVNGAGQIVGSSSFGSIFFPNSGFLYTAGSFTTISAPGSTVASGINGSGQIVGSYQGRTGPAHGFLDTAGSFTTIDVPGATATIASGINGSGQIVGRYFDASGGHGFLDTAGRFTTIDVPGATSTDASGINGSGRIVGNYSDASGSHGFVATPIPGGGGDPHFTTYDGHDYDFQAAGDFLLTRSTAPADSFDVQIRTRSWYDGAPVTVMSEVAAKLSDHRVTFDLDRASAGGSFVWVDGHPTSLSAANPTLALNGGRIVELSPNEYQVIWDTGEVLDVINAGSYLNVTFPHSPNVGPGSVEGLLGSDTGWDTDFRLADGTLLDPQISTSDLDGIFADSWRVTDATSLFDSSTAVPEPTTLTLLSIGIGLTGLGMMRRRATSTKPRLAPWQA